MYSKELINNLLKNTVYENLEIKEVDFQGHDNRTYRLGENFSIRIPSHIKYNQQILKMYELLPFISSNLNVKIPNILFIGEKSELVPYKYCICEWITGKDLKENNLYGLSNEEKKIFIENLTAFMKLLYSIKIDINNPIIEKYISNTDNFYRGNHISIYKNEFLIYLEKYKDYIDVNNVKKLFHRGLDSKWEKHVVFVHGDLMAGNILVENNRLKAIIDWGSIGIGDPACDLIISWLYFNKEERDYFKLKLDIDQNTWNRGISWALWKCLANINSNTLSLNDGIRIIENIIYDQ